MSDAQSIEISTEDKADTTIVKLSGDAGLGGAEKLQTKLTFLSARHLKHAVVDLAELTFIASLSMGHLIAFAEGVKLKGGNIACVCTAGPVRDALARARIIDVIPAFDTLDEATAAVAD